MSLDRDDRDEDRIDLSPLDPARDPRAFERFVRDTCSAAGPELLRRRVAVPLVGLIVAWRRPILAAAALLAIASGLALLKVSQQPLSPDENAVAEALGVPSTLADWTQAGDRPSPGELLEPGETAP
jgi:hypothetical protein